MAKWYKCPRCVRFSILLNKKNLLYECGECLKTFVKKEFEENDYHLHFDVDPPGTQKLIKEIIQKHIK